METLRYLKALADETRLRLAVVLYHYELSVNELVALLGMGQSRISRCLCSTTRGIPAIHREAGCLRPPRRGTLIAARTSLLKENRMPRIRSSRALTLWGNRVLLALEGIGIGLAAGFVICCFRLARDLAAPRIASFLSGWNTHWWIRRIPR